MRKIKKKVVLTGNEAIALASIEAGCRFYAGYPITPQNEIIGYMAKYMPKMGGVFIQAESELAAISMVYGAAATGFRAMTTSSSPGISLMQEGISYLAGSRLPAVIVNVMRAGPGLGGIGPSQSDYFQSTKGGGHGDYRLIVLAPSSVQEAYDLTFLAFDLADRYRAVVVLLLDAFIGQMAETLIIRDRNNIKNYDKSWALTGAQKRKPNIVRSFFIKDVVLEKHNNLLQATYREIEKKEKRYEYIGEENDNILFVAYGVSFRIAKEAANILKDRFKISVFRPITLWPYPYEALAQAGDNKHSLFVFELAYNQMLEDVKIALGNKMKIYSYSRLGGMVFNEEEIVGFVKRKLIKYAGKI